MIPIIRDASVAKLLISLEGFINNHKQGIQMEITKEQAKEVISILIDSINK